jgi:hypothetical protein
MDREQQKAEQRVSADGDFNRGASLSEESSGAVLPDEVLAPAGASVSDQFLTVRSGIPQAAASPAHEGNASQHLMPAGQWMREVMGLRAPFGHDGLPTVWG